MTELTVGSGLMTYADFEAVPIGTVIGPSNGRAERYEKKLDGWWSEDSGYYMELSEFSIRGYNKIVSLPKNVPAPVLESLIQWQFKYRDNAFVSAENAGVGRHVVTNALAELGIGDDHFPLGKGVRLGSQYDKDRLPVGAQVVKGVPEDVDRFGLFVKTERGWTHLLGNDNSMGGRVLVISGPEAEWATTPGTEEEQVALRHFKARAWRVGWKVKLSQRWCESYESYMARIGLTEESLEGDAWDGIIVGEKIGPAGSAHLPVGSLLRWHRQTDPTSFTWFIRDPDVRNEAGTRALFGHRRDGSALRNSARVMEVMHIANEDEHMDISVDNLALIWPHIPIGTRVRTGGTICVVAQDRRINTAQVDGSVPDTGPWTLDQLGSDVRIVGFPS